MTKKRTALIAGGLAAGAIAAGAVGRTVVRRRTEHDLEAPLWDLPPDDLGPVRSFDGTNLAVRAAGDEAAPMLLFVHGFSLDMTTWREQWVDLSVDHRCVLMDQRGHGASERPADGDLSVRSMGRDIAAVLEAVAPDRRVVIVGHSMGSIAILAMAEVRPDLLATSVAGLVLVGTSASELVRGAMGSITDLVRPRLGSLRSAAERVDRLRKAVLASPTDLRGAVVRLTQFGPDAPRHVVDHVVHLAERASSEVWTDGLAALLDTDLRHVLPRVRVPSLVIVGEHDRVTPPASGVELAAALPDGRFVLLEGAGHIAMLERPVELDREIRTFARSVLSAGHAPRSKRRASTKKKGGG
ncbi:MAG: alpha/beta hydrolase [Actinomycetota bacterium]|nr:alpha/beta hydrolase [Actinomycetota bacterium]MDH5224597.1 alpha/beta hydrolase [Actinomycetota bacterium]